MPDPVGVEKDLETALAGSIAARLTTDSITGVNIYRWTVADGAATDKAVLPFVSIAVPPVTVLKRGAVWEVTMEIEIHTSHTTGNDRQATQLADIAASVAACLDYSEHSTYSEWINSIQTYRAGGTHNIQDGHNITTINFRADMCGVKPEEGD